MKRTSRLLERAHAYEPFIVSQIRDRETLYPDDLDALRQKAKQHFIELSTALFPSSTTSLTKHEMLAEVALFEDMLHKLALKLRFNVMQTEHGQRYYTR